MVKLTLLLFACVITGCLSAQQSYKDSSAGYVRKIYDVQRGSELPLYNGTRHQLYSASIDGLPYFESLEWYIGSVVYDDVLYDNIIMRYDQVKDELVIAQDKITGVYISLFSPRVKEFSISGVRFVWLSDTSGKSSLKPGFYQQLTKGKLTAYTRNAKEIEEKLENTTILQLIKNNIRYYILKDGVYHSVRNANDLLDVTKEHRKEVQQFISGKQLKYRRDPKQTIIAVTEFYNQL